MRTKTIAPIEGYENETIEILEIKDISDVRVVGFLSNNNPAYVQFFKNQKGNYEWSHIEKSANRSFTTYIIHESTNKAEFSKFMIVTNQANDIAKMQLGINEQVIEQEFIVNQKSVTWIDLPESQGKTYTFKYKYYDKEGNLIGDN